VDLIAGLGNPGPEYKETRHNIGFQDIDLLSRELGVRLKGRQFQSRNVRTKFKGKEIMLICPMTFMNLSGRSIKDCVDYYDLKEENIFIVHDDLDLPVGKIKIVSHGGAGGHKGVQSIIDHFGSAQFPRVKIGIGRPLYGETTEDYVLSPFYDDQKEIMEDMIKMSARACRLFVSDGVGHAMNNINRQNLEAKEVTNLCKD
jgi:PTH1 family peptidyl-tRNA hydrolase